ncbi:MAG: metallophosphoesterase [Bacteroidetes bacterium]|nr:metallophosphoesterase [Bacteroidota bacterium]
MILGYIILFISLFLLDLYLFRPVKFLFENSKFKKLIFLGFWTIDFAFVLFCIIYSIIIKNSGKPDYVQYRNFFTIFGAFILIAFPKLLFTIFSVINDLLILTNLIFRNNYSKPAVISKRVGVRKKRFNLILKTGLYASLIFLGFLIYGIIIGRYDFTVEKVSITSPKVPKSFDGFKIVQISDLHLGSFTDKDDVLKGIKIINNQKPDIIVITGDLVNNEAIEAEIMIPVLKQMNSKYGKFAILGNHDMGDYRRWYTIKDKIENLDRIRNVYKRIGFKLLENESQFIKIKSDSICISGVLSWGLPPFKKYGDINKTLKNVNILTPKILLSHDPSHWEAEVLPKSNVLLTLSGHTHAMQFAINFAGIKWCPVSIKYPHWSGLYEENNRYLYVNRGFGYLGFPGRIGTAPEITVITLKNK